MKLSVAHGRRASAALAGLWTVTGIAAGALGLYDGFSTSTQPLYSDGPSWPEGPAASVLAVLAIGYLLFWLSLPVIVLFVGFGQLQATSAPASWQGMWITAVLAGFALDALGVGPLAVADGIESLSLVEVRSRQQPPPARYPRPDAAAGHAGSAWESAGT
jgi:hypothetical protein